MTWQRRTARSLGYAGRAIVACIVMTVISMVGYKLYQGIIWAMHNRSDFNQGVIAVLVVIGVYGLGFGVFYPIDSWVKKNWDHPDPPVKEGF